jgi:hypothetical protein
MADAAGEHLRSTGSAGANAEYSRKARAIFLAQTAAMIWVFF